MRQIWHSLIKSFCGFCLGLLLFSYAVMTLLFSDNVVTHFLDKMILSIAR